MDKTRLKEEGYISIRDIENESRARNVNNANETERHLGGQLITLSVLFLTVSVVVLGNGGTFEQLSYEARILILLTFMVIVASIGCGIKYYFVCAEYYTFNSKVHHENYEQLRDDLLNARTPDFTKINKNGKQQVFQADLSFLKRQIGLLFIGALLCIILLGTLLFSGSNGAENNFSKNKTHSHKMRNHLREVPR